jgi:hypothetical protein
MNETPKPPSATTRENRLRAALRDNLRRRKEQARGRRTTGPETAPDSDLPGNPPEAAAGEGQKPA